MEIFCNFVVVKIKQAEFAGSSTRVGGKPQRRLPEFAFIGRSNVGKSSLINMLTGQSHLAKTSQTPGKTQLVNHFLINDSWYLVCQVISFRLISSICLCLCQVISLWLISRI